MTRPAAAGGVRPARGAVGTVPAARLLGGPGWDPSAALFPVARVACPPSRCPGRPSALSLRAAPRDSAPGPLFRRLRRYVGAAARPASRLHLHSTVLPPVPLCCIPLLSSRVTCHSPGTRFLPFSFFHCLSRVYPLSPFSLWSLVTPQRLCLPHVVSHSLSIPFPSRHCLLDLSTAHCVCLLNCLSPGDSIWCF